MAFNLNEEGSDAPIGDINMTPLIDIMLVLLIIFMVGTSINGDEGLKVAVPQTSSSLSPNKGKLLKIKMGSDGKLAIKDKTIKIEHLPGVLKEIIASQKVQVVVLKGDKNAPLGKMIKVMDIAKKAGAKRFALAAESSGMAL